MSVTAAAAREDQGDEKRDQEGARREGQPDPGEEAVNGGADEGGRGRASKNGGLGGGW